MNYAFGVLLLIWTNYSLLLMSKLTLDEFFNYTEFTSLTLAPSNSQSILIQTRHRIWDHNINEYHLHLYSLDGKTKTLLTRHASSLLRPRWQGEWIVYLSGNQSNTIHLYSTRMEQTFSLPLSNESIHAFTLSNTSLYFATRTPWTNETDKAYKDEWNDVIEYRDKERGDTIYRVNLEDINRFQIEILANISLRVVELVCSFDGRRLVFSTESTLQHIESMDDYDVYSIDLTDHSSIVPRRLTNNQRIERNLKWFNNESFLFTVTNEGSINGEYRDTQGRLYSYDFLNGNIHRWADQFTGSIRAYDLLENGQQGLIILGQLNTEIQVYTQQSKSSPLVKKIGWNGTYESIVTTCNDNKSIIAFLHSSFDVPQEVYFVDNIDQLNLAQSITNENKLFKERNLPKGILLYPPDKFEQKNLPLLVLIHGGTYFADLNVFYADWYFCAIIMATEGWLVLQPNYRDSSGYGDEFLYGVRLKMVSRPGKDILFGVDALIRDGIADPRQLAIGGYSYDGYLTNWLITQTTRFNAAIIGAGAIEHVIDWGANDMPKSNAYFLGGYPWQMPTRYQEEAAVFEMNKVKTPTHIVTGGIDVRVPVAESYLLERSLRVLGIPTKLIVFLGQGHELNNNPWHEKIKVREELKWLQKYGHMCVSPCEGYLV
ncbi:unnamed protein product [Rotaria magnacalcarata]|uniref:Peptidase S9 prolyl oligopeptidase catalytic domain-containing protein n=1 Tax=Rotaria magnacalcarata TaxID=392030 RepID=A0A820ABI0_9BILA|nr:unnamed protein product [Rotaria magnacalcarata]